MVGRLGRQMLVPAWYRYPGSNWRLLARYWPSGEDQGTTAGVFLYIAPLLSRVQLKAHEVCTHHRGRNRTSREDCDAASWPASVEIRFQMTDQGLRCKKRPLDRLRILTRVMTLNVTESYCRLPHPKKHENRSVIIGNMYLSARASSKQFRANILPHLVYHWLQGVTARVVHIEAAALDAWKQGAGLWLDSGRLHLVVHNRTFATVDDATGDPTTKGISAFQSMCNALTLHMAKGAFEWVGFHDWDEYVYALSGKGISHELEAPAIEFMTELVTRIVPAKIPPETDNLLFIESPGYDLHGHPTMHKTFARVEYTMVPWVHKNQDFGPYPSPWHLGSAGAPWNVTFNGGGGFRVHHYSARHHFPEILGGKTPYLPAIAAQVLFCAYCNWRVPSSVPLWQAA